MILDLLEEKDRNLLLIAQLLEQFNDELLTIRIVSERLTLSKYKIENDIAELNSLFFKNKISITNRGEILYPIIKMSELEQLKNILIKQSKKFSLLHYIATGGTNIKKFAQNEYLSAPQAYRKRLELNNFLTKEFGIRIEGMSFKSGSEITIRNMLFDLYFFYFNGFTFPFDEEAFQHSKKTKEIILADLKVRVSKTFQEKIELFILIQYSRINYRHTIEDKEIRFIDSIFEIENDDFKELNRYLTKEEINKNEQHFINTYILLNINNKEKRALFKGKVVSLVTDFKYVFEEHIYSSDLFSEEVEANLKAIFSNWLIFSSHATSFIDEFQVNYFSEMYPVFHAISFSFVDIYCRNFFEVHTPNTQLVKYYYDLVFMLINILPVEEIEPTIKVCIDFSHGKFYNSFIEKNIEYYKDLNIEFQEYNDVKTDLYLSDVFQPFLTSKQIIWRDPPTQNDWTYFADTILELKREKYEKRQ